MSLNEHFGEVLSELLFSKNNCPQKYQHFQPDLSIETEQTVRACITIIENIPLEHNLETSVTRLEVVIKPVPGDKQKFFNTLNLNSRNTIIRLVR